MGWVWKERQSWRGSYRDEAGKQHTKSFKRQVDAKRWVATEEAKVVRGDWIDPAAGKVTFAAFYADWAPRQVWLSSTRENADLATAGVTFGDMQLRSIRRSHIEAWVKTMTSRLASTTIDTRFTIVRGVFRAAVAEFWEKGIPIPHIEPGDANADTQLHRGEFVTVDRFTLVSRVGWIDLADPTFLRVGERYRADWDAGTVIVQRLDGTEQTYESKPSGPDSIR